MEDSGAILLGKFVLGLCIGCALVVFVLNPMMHVF